LSLISPEYVCVKAKLNFTIGLIVKNVEKFCRR
jgi:hypothetical protein